MIRKYAKIFTDVMLAFLLVVVLFVLVGQFSPNRRLPIVGQYRVLVIHGGSMEPSIKLGSVIITKSIDPNLVKVGDIVSFSIPDSKAGNNKSQTIATHRVVDIKREKIYRDIGTLSFRTKGDANQEPDMQMIGAANILGKVRIAIPYAGYVVQFSKTPLGIVVMILVPGLILATGEMRKATKKRRMCQNSTSEAH